MARKKLPYQEGDWIGVPLRQGGYAVGLIARARRTGKVLFGYFFGPKRNYLPNLDEIHTLKPEDAVLLCMFGDLGLMNRKWTVIGHFPTWDRGCWPMPPFIREDGISGKKTKIYYSEDDPNCEIREERYEQDIVNLPEDGLYGSGAVEITLTKLLS